MKKYIFTVLLLALLCLLLVIKLQSQQKEITHLKGKIASQEANPVKNATSEKNSEANQSVAREPIDGNAPGVSTEAAPAASATEAQESTRRIMRNMAKTIEDNPTINKMVEASQRGAIGALYADMIAYLHLDADETNYFMDLLMYRQMANVDAHMKMASGTLSEEEKLALQEHVKQINDVTRAEMKEFLNDPDDFEEFKYYEDTIGERMMLSQMDQMLGEAALPDETYREVLDIMYNTRNNYNWSTDLNDNENRDLSPERFSKENIQKHMADMTAVGELMDKRMQEILTPEQLAAWRQSGVAMQALVEGQLMQANQMYSGE